MTFGSACWIAAYALALHLFAFPLLSFQTGVVTFIAGLALCLLNALLIQTEVLFGIGSIMMFVGFFVALVGVNFGPGA